MVKPFPLRSAGPLLALATTLLAGRAAHADEPPPRAGSIAKADPPAAAAAAPAPPAAPAAGRDSVATADWEKQKAERRGGFMLGLTLGVGVASVSGFPADPKKVNRPAYFTETGARPSGNAALWIGSAITDWFVLGIGVSAGGLLATGQNDALAGGVLVHLEGFPLYSFGGRLSELGVMLTTGIGIASVAPRAAGSDKLVDGTACSVFGGGLFYDGFRVKRLSGGPFLAGDYYWSDFVSRPAIFFGWRAALYTKP